MEIMWPELQPTAELQHNIQKVAPKNIEDSQQRSLMLSYRSGRDSHIP